MVKAIQTHPLIPPNKQKGNKPVIGHKRRVSVVLKSVIAEVFGEVEDVVYVEKGKFKTKHPRQCYVLLAKLDDGKKLYVKYFDNAGDLQPAPSCWLQSELTAHLDNATAVFILNSPVNVYRHLYAKCLGRINSQNGMDNYLHAVYKYYMF